ncbi:hypothetical protein AAY473_033985 [Plecturocebus cupreus]
MDFTVLPQDYVHSPICHGLVAMDLAAWKCPKGICLFRYINDMLTSDCHADLEMAAPLLWQHLAGCSWAINESNEAAADFCGLLGVLAGIRAPFDSNKTVVQVNKKGDWDDEAETDFLTTRWLTGNTPFEACNTYVAIPWPLKVILEHILLDSRLDLVLQILNKQPRKGGWALVEAQLHWANTPIRLQMHTKDDSSDQVQGQMGSRKPDIGHEPSKPLIAYDWLSQPPAGRVCSMTYMLLLDI